MNRLLKIVLSFIAIILALMLILPFLMGFWIKKHYPQYFAELNIRPDIIQIKVMDYQRHWFRSYATLNVTYRWAGKTDEYKVNEIIQHGPLVWVDEPVSYLTFAIAAIQSEASGPHFQGEKINIIKGSNKVISIAHVDRVNVGFDNQTVSLNDSVGKITYVPQKNIVGNLIIKHLQMQDNQGAMKLKVDNLSSRANFKKRNSLWYGTADFGIEQLMMTKSTHEVLSMHQFQLTGKGFHTNFKHDYQFHLGLGIDSINVLAIHPLSMEINGGFADAQALENLLNQIKALKNPARLKNKPLAFFPLLTPVINVLSGGAYLTLHHFSMATSEGNLEAEGALVIPKSTSVNFFSLLKSLQVNFKLQVARSLLTQLLMSYGVPGQPVNQEMSSLSAKKQIDQWIQEKKFNESGNILTMDLNLRNMHLNINGMALN